ncbi:MAG TPA: TetR/AcrR family transcriptional regulator [Longimicrobium sp.]|nr:TetR/AcrR family transcriptional regulator [Longimicrobium sp.]
MRTGGKTREHIIRQAAALFNRQGFAGASMSDIMAATGLQKGGIYRHFQSKEALAAEAFDYAVGVMAGRFTDALQGRTGALDRLNAVIDVFERIPTDPPVPGGCPVLNAAVETDDGNPLIRDRARAAVDGLRRLVHSEVSRGIETGEVRADVDAEELASVMICTLEGAVAVSRLYDDASHAQRAAGHLRQYLDERVRA